MQCLLGLMKDDEQLQEAIVVLRDRSGGHPLVNQLAAKSEKAHHGVEGGIDGLMKLFRVRGNILPVSLVDTDLNTETKNGARYHQEHQLDELKDNPLFCAGDEVYRIYLEPSANANPKVLTTLAKANKIVFPPGSPFSSIFPHLLVRGMPKSIREAKGKVVVILNLMTTKGEDHHLTKASRWLSVFQYYLGDKDWIRLHGKSRIDYLVVNENHIDPEILSIYQNQGQQVIEVDKKECQKIAPGLRIVSADLVEYDRHSHLLRHNSVKLAQTVLELS